MFVPRIYNDHSPVVTTLLYMCFSVTSLVDTGQKHWLSEAKRNKEVILNGILKHVTLVKKITTSKYL